MPGGRPPTQIGCAVPRCLRPHSSKGLCRLHYKRVERLGTPGEATPRKKVQNKLPGAKWCPSCSTFLPIERFAPTPSRAGKDGLAAYCRFCANEKSRLAGEAAREATIDIMGGCCVRCGFSDRRALQIDHVHGNGHEDKNQHARAFLKKVLANPENYQILCANCNWIKRFENGEHRRKVVSE